MSAPQAHFGEAAPANSPPAISVMIASYNRLDALRQCLQHLENQTCPDFEVFVVVDGSTDGTAEYLQTYAQFAPYPLRFLVQPNGGLSRTRNTGVPHLRAPVCLLIGNDIFASPNFVQQHLDFHRAHPQLEAVAIGYTRWEENGQTVTPFMRWLDSGQMQFAYHDLFAGVTPDWRHFYSSNLSLKSEYLRQNPSQEAFVSYGFEDIELGYRLSRTTPLSMTFLPEAVADHLHPNTFSGACKRAISIGAGSYTFGQLWPEHRTLPPANSLKRLLLRLLLTAPMLNLLRRATGLLTRMWCPNPLLRPVILLHSVLGYRRTEAAAAASHK